MHRLAEGCQRPCLSKPGGLSMVSAGPAVTELRGFEAHAKIARSQHSSSWRQSGASLERLRSPQSKGTNPGDHSAAISILVWFPIFKGTHFQNARTASLLSHAQKAVSTYQAGAIAPSCSHHFLPQQEGGSQTSCPSVCMKDW